VPSAIFGIRTRWIPTEGQAQQLCTSWRVCSNAQTPVSDHVMLWCVMSELQATAHALTTAELAASKPTPLFSELEVGAFRSSWKHIETGFVARPRRTVEDADKLVASVMQRLAAAFADERSGLDKQWDRGDNVSTEDLRVALQRYRSFFDRLLRL
jgi:hypothetical protein